MKMFTFRKYPLKQMYCKYSNLKFIQNKCSSKVQSHNKSNLQKHLVTFSNRHNRVELFLNLELK